MMNSSSHLHKSFPYSSQAWHESKIFPGVRYAIARISLRGRLQLTERLRELFQKYEFLRAGDFEDQTEASYADLLAQRLYLEWGLMQLQGLMIDGVEASVQQLVELGPEALSAEIVSAIRESLELSEQERKNS